MVWFVTGASSGLGLEMVRILAARGDTVLASGRRALAELPADFPDCAYLPCDLADLAAVMQLAEWVAGQGPLHAAVLSAGAGFYRPLAQETPDAMARVLATNLNANITLAHALHPVLSGGRLGLIGSVAHKGAAGMPVYAASKAALDGFGRALAEEWRGRTTVRVLHPGPVATGMSARAGRNPDFADRLFLPPRQTAAALLSALGAPRGADRQTVSFLRVGLHRLVKGAA
ncbi:MAG: putative short-chain dehydrogenase [Roseibaca calidilacus]|uniref:Short-chain dehydrogenase n=1 Tax=Roseibaca calidilacus TaxID=1666912 RepID=A0A0N8K7X8_9RHOB|nr:SDR family oxidoreductase [Roseibaca calidilacus]KPP92977.1 MAG: putative short-chain dehydrogenase [Roseibaca calidilacus]CUX80354.1 Short-chain dehydrogenase [Roseibaca calidilacus]